MSGYLLEYNGWRYMVPNVLTYILDSNKHQALCRFIRFLDTRNPHITYPQAIAIQDALSKQIFHENKSTFLANPVIDSIIRPFISEYPNFGNDFEIIVSKKLPGVSDSAKIVAAYMHALLENRYLSLGSIDYTKSFQPLKMALIIASINQALGVPQEMRSRVNIADQMAQIIITEFHHFLNKVRLYNWGNLCKYVNKYLQESVDEKQSRAFLIYTKVEVPNTFFIIIKSQTNIRKALHLHTIPPEYQFDQNIMFGRGTTKIAKINGHLITINMPHEWLQSVTIPTFRIEEIVTFTRISATSDTYLSHDYAKKTHDLEAHLKTPKAKFDFFGWNDFVKFRDPSHPHEFRLIGYQKKVGTSDCSDPKRILDSWTIIQRVRSSCSILNDALALLDGTKHPTGRIWPVDLKFPNMRVDASIPELPKLLLIDYIGDGSTFSLYKGEDLVIPPQTDDRTAQVQNCDLRRYMQILKQLNERTRINDNEFKLLAFQLFFEILYNIFFVMNPSLLTNEIYKQWLWNRPPVPRATMERNVPNGYFLRDLLIDYTYDQNFELNIDQIARHFIFSIQTVLLSTILSPDVPVHILQANDLINSTFDGSPLNPTWPDKFVAAIVDFRTSPTPFHPIQIRNLRMI